MELESWPLNEPWNCLWRCFRNKASAEHMKPSTQAPESFLYLTYLLHFLRVQNHLPATLPFSLPWIFLSPLLPWNGEGCRGCGRAGSVISRWASLLMRPSSWHWQIKCGGEACLLDREWDPGCQLLPLTAFLLDKKKETLLKIFLGAWLDDN